jgi:hypothetical protein
VTAVTAPARPAPAIAARRTVAAALLLAAAIGCCTAALGDAGQPAGAVAWGSISLTAYAASLLCVVGGGRGKYLGLSRWRLGSWTLAWYGTAFGLATLTWVQPSTGTPTQISQTSVLRALWLVAVGMTLWMLGYFVGPGRPARRFGNKVMAALDRRFTPELRSPLAPWLLYAIATVARLAIAVTTGRFGYVGAVQSAVSTASGYQQWLSYLSLCAPLAVAAAALQVYREHLPGARVTLAVLFLAEMTFGAIAGGKQSFIITVLAVTIPFAMARHRVHLGLLIFAVLAFLVILVPFNQAYRSAARSSSGTLSVGQALDAVPGVLVRTISTGSVGGALSSSASFMLARIREIDSPAIIMQRTPTEIGYLSPAQLVEAPVMALIPRAVWPGKPILASGYQFGQEYYDLPSKVYSSSAVTPAGDLYRHGGWVPVIIGMFLLGCGVRLLDDTINVQANPQSAFLFILLFPSLVKQENDWVGMLAGLPGLLLVWFLAVHLTFRKRPQPSRRRSWRGPAQGARP